jgi:hypothetical protein
MQKGAWSSGVWDLCHLRKSIFNHHKGGWILEKKKISIIVCGGALMDSIVLRNEGFSGCAA